MIKNLFDIIKNPDYDIHDVTNHWVMSRKNFFDHDCLKEIKTIHITVYYMRFNYLPMASAILRKVNTNRRKEKTRKTLAKIRAQNQNRWLRKRRQKTAAAEKRDKTPLADNPVVVLAPYHAVNSRRQISFCESTFKAPYSFSPARDNRIAYCHALRSDSRIRYSRPAAGQAFHAFWPSGMPAQLAYR